MKTIYIVLIAIIIIIAFVMALIMIASNTRTKYGGKSIFEQMTPGSSDDSADSDAPKKEGWEEWVELANMGSQQEESSEEPAEDVKEHVEEDKKADVEAYAEINDETNARADAKAHEEK